MANSYKIEVEFADGEEGKYSITDSMVTFTEQANTLTIPEMTAINQTISYLMPLIRKAGIKKLEIKLE